MEVVISSGGVYHAYHAARAAAEAGYLKQFMIGIYDPNRAHGIPPELYQKIPLPNYIGHAIQQIPAQSMVYFSYLIRDNLYDRIASRKLAGCDIFHGWNHMSLHTLREAKKRGAKIAIERCSAHPVTSNRLYVEEFERHGLKFPITDSWLIEKQVQEYAEADIVITCSDFVTRTMQEENVPAGKIRQLTLGFDPADFTPQPDQRDPAVFRVIYAGAIGLPKGVHYLLEAFQRLNLPDAELVLVGGTFPDSRTFLPRYEGIYRHVPFVPHQELVKLYNSADVFVLPSLLDGFGMVVYEAAACGLPVIITENVGAPIREDVDGFRIPIRDPDALAEKLLYLYENRDACRQMGDAAREYVQQFTWEAYHRQLVDIYDEMGKG